MKGFYAFSLLSLVAISCKTSILTEVQQWTTHEITLQAANSYSNGYTDIDVWGEFISDKGEKLIRPAFWDGENTWKIRVAPTDSSSKWDWETFSSAPDQGLAGIKGSFKSVGYPGDNPLLKHGLLSVSRGKRNVVHHNGQPFLVVGDTPWSIPFRATTEQVRVYANDRQNKGFNVALLMSVQPDMNARGPEERNTIEGFDIGFADWSEGSMNQLKPDYYQYLDSLISILVDYGIVPVYQPVFHGYGWKGLQVLGPVSDPDEYARYCKYLVARFGSMPAFWLVGGDAAGRDPGVGPGGEMIEKWDTYQQPAGIHYNPCDNYLATWAVNDSLRCFHYNSSFQDAKWLDFQWAQSGHDGRHLPYKVEGMYEKTPTKANLNGEPTYEGMSGGKFGLGWWQGHEAWNNLMHGGTMGVVYGAASLWQWKVTADEPGWPIWTDQPLSWRGALDLEGSKYVGYVSKAFQGFGFTDMEKHWELAGGAPLLAKPGKFYVSYLQNGGVIQIKGVPEGLNYTWFNPQNGTFAQSGQVDTAGNFTAPDANPWVLLIGDRQRS